jgi:hypothetical protein
MEEAEINVNDVVSNERSPRNSDAYVARFAGAMLLLWGLVVIGETHGAEL